MAQVFTSVVSHALQSTLHWLQMCSLVKIAVKIRAYEWVITFYWIESDVIEYPCSNQSWTILAQRGTRSYMYVLIMQRPRQVVGISCGFKVIMLSTHTMPLSMKYTDIYKTLFCHTAHLIKCNDFVWCVMDKYVRVGKSLDIYCNMAEIYWQVFLVIFDTDGSNVVFVRKTCQSHTVTIAV